MKKNILVFTVLLVMHMHAYGQQMISSFLDKYSKDENIELTNIGRRMFSEMENQALANPKLSNIISELDNISIVSSVNSSSLQEYYDTAIRIIARQNDLSPLFENEGDDSLLVMIREQEGLVKELIVLSKDASSFNLVSMTGDIQLETLVNYSRNDNFETLKEMIPQEKP